MATSGALMIGVNPVPPMPPSDDTVKQPPCISIGFSLPLRACSASPEVSAAIDRSPFVSAIPDNWHDQTVRSIGSKSDMEVTLQHQLFPFKRRVECGMFL